MNNIPLNKEKKEFVPSNHFCVICGRYTNEKKRIPNNIWGNYFFSCYKCKTVWCANCMGLVTGLGAKKTFILGKKGEVKCNECDILILMKKLPENLPFVQKKTHQEIKSEEIIEHSNRYCSLCGQKISLKAKFCESCGVEQ